MDGMIEGFERRRLPGHDIEVDAVIGGSGPPLLLIHGCPQTRLCWKDVAPRLAEKFTVVVPDLRGYGRSDKPQSDSQGTLYSKRIMAQDQVSIMKKLGFDRFSVAGHDRGARVAYRLAFEAPQAVERVAVLDVVPTAEMWKVLNSVAGLKGYHWTFLAQPVPLPERLIAGDPELFLHEMLYIGAGPGFKFDDESLADYRACFANPAGIHGVCCDYRANWHIDRLDDEADAKANRKLAQPLLVTWGDKSPVSGMDLISTWRKYATDVRGHAWSGGHFGPEEDPDGVTKTLKDFFS